MHSTACRQERFAANANVDLRFEVDSVLFDTVFATVGTITKRFKVYNPTSKNISIDEIYLGGRRMSGSSNFRLNINGLSRNEVQGMQLAAGDSLYVFVEATIDPNNSLTPYLVYDSVMFRSGNQVGRVYLTAFGQNAYFIGNEIVPCDTQWTNLLPIVVYESILVDSLCKLTIQAGTKLYFARNATLFVLGTLEVNGTDAAPVEFRGDRIDPFYRDLSGGWNGIHFLRGSVNNQLRYANLKNGTIAVRVDSLPVSGLAPNVRLLSCAIDNFSIAGIVGFTAHIEADNLLVTECGRYNVYGDLGGIYRFRHATLASYGFNFSRSTPVVFLSNAPYNGSPQTIDASFRNSIITGNRREEFVLDTAAQGTFNVELTYNIIRTERSVVLGTNNRYNVDPKFKSPVNSVFEIDTLSPAFRAGENLQPFFPQLGLDLLGKPRSTIPTLGAIERTE
jgi:hypothetical protein